VGDNHRASRDRAVGDHELRDATDARALVDDRLSGLDELVDRPDGRWGRLVQHGM
jgi:hypothetical protein